MDIRTVDLLSDDPEHQRLADGFVRVQEERSRSIWGERHCGWSAEELRGQRQGTDHRYVDLVALDGDEVVGMVGVAMPLDDNTEMAFAMLRTAPGHDRKGVGSALIRAAEEAARGAGRTVMEAETEYLIGNPPEHDQFASAYGYTSALVMIRSEMALPGDRELLRAQARGEGAREPERFDVQVRVDEIPDAWLPDLAHLTGRMATDAPQGDRELAEENWTAQRVREKIDWALGAGRHFVAALAFDGDRAVGFSTVELPPTMPRQAFQQDTLVLREARGHGLGARMKAAAALELAERFPQLECVITCNARDNAHMLATNAALGYVRTGVLTVWSKRLS